MCKLLFMLKLIPNILTFGRLVLTIVFLVMLLLAPPYYADGEVPFPGFLDIAFIIFVTAGLNRCNGAGRATAYNQNVTLFRNRSLRVYGFRLRHSVSFRYPFG